MRLRILLFLLIIFKLVPGAHSQETYWKRYNIGGSDVGPGEIRVIETSDTGIAILSHFYNYESILLKENADTISFCKSYASTTGGTQLYDFFEMPDGGFMACGFSQVSFSNNDIYLMRMDSIGDLLWGHTYSAPGTLLMKSLVPNSSYDSFTAVGWVQGVLGILTFDLNGIIISSKRIDNVDGAISIIRTTDNGYLVTASTSSYGAGLSDILLIKLNSLTNIQWAKTYGLAANETPYSVIETTTGFLLTGTSTALDPNGDILMAELNSSGNLVWSKIYSTPGYIYPKKTKIAADSAYVIVTATNFPSYFDMGIQKIDLNGNIIWSKYFTNDYHDSGDDFILTDDNQVIIYGEDSNVSLDDYIDCIKLNLEGKLGCFEATLPVSVIDTLISISAVTLSPAVVTISLDNTNNFTSDTSVVIDTLCYCQNLAIVDFNSFSCYSDTIQFTSSIYPDSSYESLVWNFGGGNFSGETDPKHSYTFPGSYSVSLSVTDSTGCTSIKTKSISFVPYSSITMFEYSASATTVNFYDTTAYATNWLWDFGDGFSDTVQNPVHVYTGAGIYNVCLISSNSCGSDTICQMINVSSTGISESFSDASIDIFPNPFALETIVEIKGTNIELYDLAVYNSLGQLITYSAHLTEKRYVLNGSDLPNGCYYIKIFSSDGTPLDQKIFLIQR